MTAEQRGSWVMVQLRLYPLGNGGHCRVLERDAQAVWRWQPWPPSGEQGQEQRQVRELYKILSRNRQVVQDGGSFLTCPSKIQKRGRWAETICKG